MVNHSNSKSQNSSKSNNKGWTDEERKEYRNLLFKIATAYFYKPQNAVYTQMKDVAGMHKINFVKYFKTMVKKGVFESFNVEYELVHIKTDKYDFEAMNPVLFSFRNVNPLCNDKQYEKIFAKAAFDAKANEVYMTPMKDMINDNQTLDEHRQMEFESHLREISERSNVEYISSEDRVKRSIPQEV